MPKIVEVLLPEEIGVAQNTYTNPDFTQILVACNEGYAVIDIEAHKILAHIVFHNLERIADCYYNNEQGFILAILTSETLVIQSADTAKKIQIFYPENPFKTCSWSPDGTRLVCVDDKNRLTIFQVSSNGIDETATQQYRATDKSSIDLEMGIDINIQGWSNDGQAAVVKFGHILASGIHVINIETGAIVLQIS